MKAIRVHAYGPPEQLAIRLFGNHPDGARLAKLAAAVAEGRLVVAEPRIMPLSEAAEAHQLMERGGAGKIVLVPDQLL